MQEEEISQWVIGTPVPTPPRTHWFPAEERAVALQRACSEDRSQDAQACLLDPHFDPHFDDLFLTESPMHLVCEQNFPATLRVLLAGGSGKIHPHSFDFDWRGRGPTKRHKVYHQYQRNTPLHIASRLGHLEAVELLLADPRVDDLHRPNLSDQTPLDVATQEALALLVESPKFSPKDGDWEAWIHQALELPFEGVGLGLLQNPRFRLTGEEAWHQVLWRAILLRRTLVSGHIREAREDIYRTLPQARPFDLLRLCTHGDPSNLHHLLQRDLVTVPGAILPSLLDQGAPDQVFEMILSKNLRLGPHTRELREPARSKGRGDIAELVGRYALEPAKTARGLCQKYGWSTWQGKLYASMVLVNCKCLAMGRDPRHGKIKRFFGIGSKLPAKLQMRLCNAVYSDPSTTIESWDGDHALRRYTS